MSIEAMKDALFCLSAWDRGCEREDYWRDIEEAITTLRTAIEQMEKQEPDYSICPTCGGMASDPIVPPAAQRQPLMEEEIAELAERMDAVDPTDSYWKEFVRSIEAAHSIK